MIQLKYHIQNYSQTHWKLSTKLYIGSDQADFNEVFNVMFSIGDISDISYGSNNKSYTLNLPLTKTNKKLLKYANNAGIKTEITSTGRLYLNEILILKGKVIVLSYSDLFAKIIITASDWIMELGKRKMTALDLSASDHSLTKANIEASWTASYPVYRYPLINFGALASKETGTTAKWMPSDFIPMIRVLDLVSKILSPYAISSAWDDISAVKDYYILGRETIAVSTFIEGKDLDVYGDAAADNQDTETIAPAASGTASVSRNVKLYQTTINEGGHWFNDVYTVPETGTYRFVATMITSTTKGYFGFTETGGSFALAMLQTGSASRTLASATASRIVDATTYVLDSGFVHLVAGDEIVVNLSCSSTCTNNTSIDADLVVGLSPTSTLELIWNKANLYSGINKNISLEEYLPDMTQLEFLSEIRDLFNLRFWMDKSRNTVYVDPWDLLLSSTVVDLSDRVDYENIDVSMISQNYMKDILFRWQSDSSDKAYEEYFKAHTDINEKQITLTSEYVKEGIDIRESKFSTIIKGYHKAINNWSIELPEILAEISGSLPDVFDRLVNFNTRIVEWKGMTSGLTWYFETSTKTTYPKIEGIDFDTLYTTYWMKFFHYVDKGKLFTVRIKVSPTWVSQFLTVINTSSGEGFRPTYKIAIDGNDTYFFLQKITTDGDIAELELILKV